jgi:molybdopterin molybdotransferase
MKLLTVDTIDEAREKLWEKVKSRTLEKEAVSLGEAQGRILSEDLYAPGDIPCFRRATVDGYAVLAADTAGAGEALPVFLKQAGSVSMGKSTDFSIQSGEAAYVPTGGMLPEGADAVVMVEYAENAGGNTAGDSIAVYEAAARGAGIAEAGEDIRKGEPLLCKGAVIRPQEAGLLAASGITDIPVFSPLSISLISTGDELVPPEQNPGPAQIRDTNSRLLEALALKRGFRVVAPRLFPDDADRLEAAVSEALTSSDVIVVSGGSSQGEKDFTASVINKAAKPGVFTHGLALKPGKPTILGWDEKTQTVLGGLPGHPVSAMMVFELILSWLHNRIFNLPPALPVPARISCNLPGSPGRTLCQPVTLRLEEGAYLAEPVFGKSGMITTLTRADGYIIVDLNREGLKNGESVLVHLL